MASVAGHVHTVQTSEKNFATRRVVAYGIDDVHQADLADMSRHAQANDGVTFLLVVIDVFSKFAWVVPMKDKSNKSVVTAFKKIYGNSDARRPGKLGTDAGTEFLGRMVRELLKQSYSIHQYTLGNRQKAAVAERFIRTLKTKLHKLMDSGGSERYIDSLQDIVDGYNSSVHRSIKMKPKDVNYENAGKVYRTLYAKGPKKTDPLYGVGDRVRISVFKKTFSKGYEQNYSDEIFQVVRVLNTRPPVYKLEDYYGEPIGGTFYGRELTKVIVGPNKTYRIEHVLKEQGRGRNKRWLIKYRGYREPEWTSSPPVDIRRLR